MHFRIRQFTGALLFILGIGIFPRAKALAQKEPASADLLIKKTVGLAAKEKKQALLIFASSYNPWSKLIDSCLDNEVVKAHYVIQHISTKEEKKNQALENPGAAEMITGYKADNPYDSPLPVTLILDRDGHKLADFTGFPQGSARISEYADLLQKAANLSKEERDSLDNHFFAAYKKAVAPPVNDIIQAACEQSGRKNKKVLLIFSASWCTWCHAIDTAINDPACKKLFEDRFVISHARTLEFGEYIMKENFGARDLLFHYQIKHQQETGHIPIIWILDNNGNVIADFDGFPSDKDGQEDLIRFLKKASELSPEQAQTIMSAFDQVYTKTRGKSK